MSSWSSSGSVPASFVSTGVSPALGPRLELGLGLEGAELQLPGALPFSFLSHPMIILSITFINTLHSAGFFHAS